MAQLKCRTAHSLCWHSSFVFKAAFFSNQRLMIRPLPYQNDKVNFHFGKVCFPFCNGAFPFWKAVKLFPILSFHFFRYV